MRNKKLDIYKGKSKKRAQKKMILEEESQNFNNSCQKEKISYVILYKGNYPQQ